MFPQYFLYEVLFPRFLYLNFIIYYDFQWSFYKAFYAIFGCICPLFATSAAIGLLFFLGLRFGSILFVTPFLILAIGLLV